MKPSHLLLVRSIPIVHDAPRRALAAVLLRFAVSVAAVTTLAKAVVDLRDGVAPGQLGAFLSLALALILIESLAIGRDRRSVGSARGVSFALLLTAQLTLGLGAAAWLGVIAAVVGTVVVTPDPRLACDRAVLVVSLLAAGEWLAGPGVGWFPYLMGGIAIFFTVWLLRIRRRISRWNLASGMLVRAWVGALATHELWPVAGAGMIERLVTTLTPLAIRVAGALLADLLIVLTLTIGLGALSTLDAWSIRMPPVVLRLHVLALTAVPLILLYSNAGPVAFGAGVCLIALLTLAICRRPTRARTHELTATHGTVPDARSLSVSAGEPTLSLAYCLTI